MPIQYPGGDDLKGFSVAGITDLANQATSELNALRASVTADTATDEQLDRMEHLRDFTVTAADAVKAIQDKAARFDAATAVDLPTETVTASGTDDEAKDVSETVPTSEVAGHETAVVAATVTPAAVATPRMTDIAPLAPGADIPTAAEGYTIIASSDSTAATSGTALTWIGLAEAFDAKAAGHQGLRANGTRLRSSAPLGVLRRDFADDLSLLASDSDVAKYTKLETVSNLANRGDDSLVAANGWCAPSETDYSICSPITTDGLLQLPEITIRRGGLRHTQGLDFSDFFGDDFVLPIPGFNTLTEAQVIADTAKTCVEIPCPPFVDDRLNVAALCLTSSLLQNRGYPEFVSAFMRGATAAMAHLVNREILNEIVTGSTAVTLATTDPWVTDGSVVSQVMSAVDLAITDARYNLRTSQTQQFTVVFPYWLKTAMRADWLRRNAESNPNLVDAMIDAMLAVRGARAQWIYGWQDAFNPGAIIAGQQMGATGVATTNFPFSTPTSVEFLVFLPGTWVVGRQDVIRLETVYDSTNLQQNLVTQLFMEDGYKPMRMCTRSAVYTVPICANGSTGVQRAVACADVTPA